MLHIFTWNYRMCLNASRFWLDVTEHGEHVRTEVDTIAVLSKTHIRPELVRDLQKRSDAIGRIKSEKKLYIRTAAGYRRVHVTEQ